MYNTSTSSIMFMVFTDSRRSCAFPRRTDRNHDGDNLGNKPSALRPSKYVWRFPDDSLLPHRTCTRKTGSPTSSSRTHGTRTPWGYTIPPCGQVRVLLFQTHHRRAGENDLQVLEIIIAIPQLSRPVGILKHLVYQQHLSAFSRNSAAKSTSVRSVK